MNVLTPNGENDLNTKITNIHTKFNKHICHINKAHNLEDLMNALNGLICLAKNLRDATGDFPDGVGLEFLNNALVFIPFFENREPPDPGEGIFSFEGNRNLTWNQDANRFEID